MKDKRIVVIGDSLAMPRYEVSFEDTYPYLLNQELENCEVIVRNRRANTTKSQVNPQNILDDIVFLKSKTVIIHLGIVDCAPRLFNKFEQLILSKLKGINKFIIKFFSKYRFFFTKINPKVYVNKKEFYHSLLKLIQECKKNGVENIFVLNICNTNSENKKKSFNFENNIQEYNNILYNVVKEQNVILLDVNSKINEDMLLEDGIHLNLIGHRKIYEIIRENFNVEKNS